MQNEQTSLEQSRRIYARNLSVGLAESEREILEAQIGRAHV